MEEKILGKCSNCGAEIEMTSDGCYTCDNCHIGVAKLHIERPKYSAPCILCGAIIPVQYGDFSGKTCDSCKALWARLKFEFTQGRFSHD